MPNTMMQNVPYTLHPTPYTLHPTPYTLHHTPYTLCPIPYTLHPGVKMQSLANGAGVCFLLFFFIALKPRVE